MVIPQDTALVEFVLDTVDQTRLVDNFHIFDCCRCMFCNLRNKLWITFPIYKRAREIKFAPVLRKIIVKNFRDMNLTRAFGTLQTTAYHSLYLKERTILWTNRWQINSDYETLCGSLQVTCLINLYLNLVHKIELTMSGGENQNFIVYIHCL